MKWVFVGLALSMLLAGCATMTPQHKTDFQRKILATQPHCLSQRQCEAAWSAALNWVNHNCSINMQTVTDSYIETYHWFDTSLACRITKYPDQSGGYSLGITILCRNMFRCVPDVHEAEQSFDSEVKGVVNQFAKQ